MQDPTVSTSSLSAADALQRANAALEALAALQQVSLSLTSTLDLKVVLERVAQMAQSLCGSAHAHIYLYNAAQDELTLGASYWGEGEIPLPLTPRRGGLTYTVARSGQPEFINDTAHHPAYTQQQLTYRPGAIAVLPLRKGDRVLGTLNLGYWEPHEFAPETIDFIELLASQAALAIDNAQLYSAAAHRAQELAALREISLDISAQLDLQTLLQAVVRRGSELLGASGGAVYLYDPSLKALKFFAEYGFHRVHRDTVLKLGEGLSGRAAQERKPFSVNDYERWEGRSTSYSGEPLAAAAAVPLLWQEQVLGTLAFQMEAGNPRTFSEDDLRLMEQLAAQTAIAIQNARLYTQARQQAEELAQRVQELGIVNRVSQHVSALDLQQVQETALEELAGIFRAELCGIALRNPETGTVTTTAVYPRNDPALGAILHIANAPAVRESIERKQPIIWHDDPSFEPTPLLNFFRRRGTRELVVAPLCVQDRVIGFLGVDTGSHRLSPTQVTLLQTIANQIAIAMENARLYQASIEQALMEQELRVARLIQQTLLPKSAPQIPGWQIAACYRPAHAVGGDLYDFVLLPDGRLGIIIGDVTDKGVPAALMMANTHAVLRTEALSSRSPSQVLTRVNQALCPDMPAKMFVTCSYAILDPATGKLELANAGHNVPYRWKTSPVEEVHASGMPIGLFPGWEYDQTETVIEPGENLLFYSDGIVEAHNPAREMFSFPRLQAFLHDRPGGPPIIEDVLGALHEFTGKDWEQEDDITIVTLRRDLYGDPRPDVSI